MLRVCVKECVKMNPRCAAPSTALTAESVAGPTVQISYGRAASDARRACQNWSAGTIRDCVSWENAKIAAPSVVEVPTG